jgi:polyferredoxin
MDDQLNFDTLDILAAAVGVVIAFMLLPFPADRLTERIVVPLCALAVVTIKRFVIRTKQPNPDSSTSVRLVYLLIAIVGTICLGLALLAIFIDLQEFSEPEIIEVLLGSGIIMLIIATFIDRRWLKLRE